MIDMAIDGVGALTRAAEDAAKTASHDRSFADAASETEQAAKRPKLEEAAPAAPAEKSWWDSFKGAVGSAAHTVDAGAHQLGDAANHMAEDAISAGTDAVRHVAGNGVADVLHGAAEGVRETAKQAVGFTYGVGAGATEAVGGMVEGTGDLIGDGVRMATDPAFRGQVVQGAEALAQHVAADPLGTAKAVGSGALHAGENWVRGVGRAAQEGNLGEYLGRGVGSAAVNVGSFFVPGAGEAEAANVAGHLAEAGEVAGKLGEAGEAAGAAGDVASGVEHAVELHSRLEPTAPSGIQEGARAKLPNTDEVPAPASTLASGARPSPVVSSQDISAFRNRIGVPETNTVGVGRTNVPGLEGEVFEGGSTVVRREAGLPATPDGPITSPSTHPMFRDHAEQDIANQFVRAVDRAGLTPEDLNGSTLLMRIQNETGICNTCRQGLKDTTKLPGVLKQLSQRYPGLNIHVVVDNPGPKLRGPAEFTLRDGSYVQ